MVEATTPAVASDPESGLANASAGVRQPNTFRGRPLSSPAPDGDNEKINDVLQDTLAYAA